MGRIDGSEEILAALPGLMLQAGVLWVCLSMMSENVGKSCVGFLRYRSGKWVRDVTVPNFSRGGLAFLS